MKRFLSLFLLSVFLNTHGNTAHVETQFRCLEQPLITAHAHLIKRELESTYRARVVTAIVGTALAIASIYGLYKIWPSIPATPQKPAEKTDPNQDSAGKTNTSNTSNSNKPPTLSARTHSWLGSSIRAIGTFAKNSLFSVANILPAGFALLAINTIGATAITKTVNACERYYRSLNWPWMLTTKTALETRCQHVVHYAALLEGTDTPTFEILKNTHINWQTTIAQGAELGNHQHIPVVTAHTQPHPTLASQYVPLNTFDELVKLQLLAGYGAQLSAQARTAVRSQFINSWNELIAALTHCLGYLTYKHANAQTASPTMREQLRTFISDIITHTNALAQKLPQLLDPQQNAMQPSEHILAQVYAYTKLLKEWCLTLEINPILA